MERYTEEDKELARWRVNTPPDRTRHVLIGGLIIWWVAAILMMCAGCSDPTAPRPVIQHTWPSPTTITGIPPHAMPRGAHLPAPIRCTDCSTLRSA